MALFDRCQGYVLAQVGESPAGEKVPLRALTISRETGAGAVTIGQLIADYLQEHQPRGTCPWCVFDRNLVEKVLEDHALPKRIGEFMPEDRTPELRGAFEEFLGVHPASWTLVEHTNETIRRLAEAGNAVIVGRGANLITANLAHVFHVRLVAPLEQRITHVAAYYQLSHAAAATFVAKTDLARKRYVRRNFSARADDPLHYHLVLNTGRMSFPDAARLIAEAVMSLASQKPSP